MSNNQYPNRNKSLLLYNQVFQSKKKKKKSPHLKVVLFTVAVFSAFQLALHKITIFWEILRDEALVLMPKMGTVLDACSLTLRFLQDFLAIYTQSVMIFSYIPSLVTSVMSSSMSRGCWQKAQRQNSDLFPLSQEGFFHDN